MGAKGSREITREEINALIEKYNCMLAVGLVGVPAPNLAIQSLSYSCVSYGSLSRLYPHL